MWRAFARLFPRESSWLRPRDRRRILIVARADALTAVSRIFIEAVFARHRERAGMLGIAGADLIEITETVYERFVRWARRGLIRDDACAPDTESTALDVRMQTTRGRAEVVREL